MLFPPNKTKEAAQETLRNLVQRDPRSVGIERSRWTLRILRDHCAPWLGLKSLSGLWQALKRAGIHFKRARDYVHSPDPDYEEKKAYIADCIADARRNPQHCVAIYQDEAGFYRQPSLANAYYQCGSAEQPYAYRSHRANTVQRIIGGVNALTGQVTYRLASRASRAQLIKFYQQLCDTYPDATTIYVIQDNWPVHVHPDIVARLPEQRTPFWPILSPFWSKLPPQPKTDTLTPLQFVFLPTYASWLNPIEKLWRWLKQEVLHLHNDSNDWDNLKARVHTFLDRFVHASPDLLRYIGLSIA